MDPYSEISFFSVILVIYHENFIKNINKNPGVLLEVIIGVYQGILRKNLYKVS